LKDLLNFYHGSNESLKQLLILNINHLVSWM
jgi:hypothetical protein